MVAGQIWGTILQDGPSTVKGAEKVAAELRNRFGALAEEDHEEDAGGPGINTVEWETYTPAG